MESPIAGTATTSAAAKSSRAARNSRRATSEPTDPSRAPRLAVRPSSANEDTTALFLFRSRLFSVGQPRRVRATTSDGGIREGAAARSTSRLLEKTEISVRRNRADPLSRADARLKMARVTHLAAWRAAKAAVATWRAPIKVCVVVRWWERVRSHRRQTRKTRRDASRATSRSPKNSSGR